ncbi:MAG: hypothetical protein B9S32_16165 [Verrucomicrobia bacterium Tous-C9LFEB]|nr:MAG: hypothetical protein B9S32_16165 [Verrucomicrobia bacterium Tous-C9LFEB]
MQMREIRTWKLVWGGLFLLACCGPSFLQAEYKSPNWQFIPYNPDRTALSVAERSQLAVALTEYARYVEVSNPAADTLRAKALALAMRLDPESKSAIILNGKLKRGGYTPEGSSTLSREEFLKLFLMQVKNLQAGPSSPRGDSHFAAYLLDFLATVDPDNEDLLYNAEIEQRKFPVSWQAVIASAPTPRSPVTPGSVTTAAAPVTPTVPTTPTTSSTALKQTQSKIKGLVVMSSDDNVLGGKVLEIITTANPAEGGSTCQLSAKAGEDMKIALSEAFRFIKMRHPESANGISFTLSFEDKYTKMAGGSAGTAFAVGMMSILDNLTIDTKVAMTGDITVDGKVRKVGGVPTKIRGAKLGGCELVGIPVENESDVANLMVMNGYRAASEIQIFSINTLDEAIGLARQDRSEKLNEAIKVFAEVQQDLNGSGSIGSAETATKLDKVLDLAPNHLSAKYLREKTRGALPTLLTPTAAIDELFNAAGPLMLFFNSLDKEEQKKYSNRQILVFTLPKATYTGVREQLTQLEKKMPPQIQSTYYAMINLLDRVEYFDGQYKGVPHRSAVNLYNANFSNDLPRRTRIDDISKQYQVLIGELTKLDYDKQFIEAQLH